jgi:hypothetical protein
VAGNYWQRSIYWVHQWWKYWRPGLANLLPETGYHQMATDYHQMVTGYHQMATGYHPMAKGFRPKRILYLLSQNPHCFPLRW